MSVCFDSSKRPVAMAFEFEEVRDTVNAMLRQEATTYKRIDFLADSSQPKEVVDANWRFLMCKWMHDMADVWNISRDMAGFGAYFLDMVLAKSSIVQTLQDLQLATMTCLHLAIKLNSFILVSHKSVVKYGRGQFTVDDMAGMEQKIIKTLQWQLHPPTSRCFQRQFMRLFPIDEVDESTIVLISEVSRFLIELASNDYAFIRYSGASTAYAALIIAIEGTCRIDLSMGQRSQFYCRMRTVVGISHTSKELFEVYTLMKHTFKEADDINGLIKGEALWKSSTSSLERKMRQPNQPRSPRGIESVRPLSTHNPAA